MEKFNKSSIDQLSIQAEVISDTLQILYDYLESEGYQGRISISEVNIKNAVAFVAHLPEYLNLLFVIQEKARLLDDEIRKVLKVICSKEEGAA